MQFCRRTEGVQLEFKESFKFKNIVDCLKKYYLFIVFGFLTLLLPDMAIKSLLGQGFFSQGYVGAVSWLFTVFWILLIIAISTVLLPKRWGKITFSILSAIYIVFSFSEYIYYKIFDQFFWLKSIMLAGEGSAYLDQVLQQIDTRLIVFTILEILFMILTLALWNRPNLEKKAKICIMILPIIGITVTHISMQQKNESNDWDVWKKPRIVYKNFNDINKNMEIAGIHQFLYRDAFSSVFPKKQYKEEDFIRADKYLEEKGPLIENDYTSIFEGKNVIVVMMESMDTWTINEKDTPTLHMMMEDGINFTNYNYPFFGAGFTFGAEFAFNTGFYTPSSAISASKFSTNTFPYSLARLFNESGYATNSFHFNSPEFYNRGIMHKSFGYEKYNSLDEFGVTGVEAELDSNMMRCDGVYEKMTETTPFMDFVVTYSMHLPYTGESPKLELAKTYYPELINKTENEKRNNTRILSRDTDEFFRILLEKLKADDLLDDTVIIAYTDHFAYGVYDDKLLEEWKGDKLSYTIPAFIYAKGIKHQEISKPMMTVDWAPTIVNLFGLETDAVYLGNDILSPENTGFALFETWAWLDEKMYYEHSDTEPLEEDKERIEKNNKRVKDSIEINDIMVLGDYYKHR